MCELLSTRKCVLWLWWCDASTRTKQPSQDKDMKKKKKMKNQELFFSSSMNLDLPHYEFSQSCHICEAATCLAPNVCYSWPVYETRCCGTIRLLRICYFAFFRQLDVACSLAFCVAYSVVVVAGRTRRSRRWKTPWCARSTTYCVNGTQLGRDSTWSVHSYL